MKSYKTLHEKRLIVTEAYSKVYNIKPSAAKYNVQTHQIRYWQKCLALADLCGPMNEAKKTVNNGPKFLLRSYHNVLHHYFEDMRAHKRVVSINMLCREVNGIIEENKKYFYRKFTSHLSKYSKVYREDFFSIKNNLYNKLYD